MDIRKRIGAAVQRLRTEKGWSQEQLADEANLHRTYISGIERGIRNPTITVLEKVAVALGAKIGSLADWWADHRGCADAARNAPDTDLGVGLRGVRSALRSVSKSADKVFLPLT
jgi:transcriptional regulator with XRE-family HTH domain